MTAVLTKPIKDDAMCPASLPDASRRCLALGEAKPKTALIRFVLDPQGVVVPDLAEKLPGRGLWVSALRGVLEDAVRKNLFSKAAKTKAKVSPDLPAQVERLLARRCGELLGLARAAGAVVTREPVVLEALAKGELSGVLLASDAGGDVRKKLSRVPDVFQGFSRDVLGEALGREHLAVVGLKPHPLTKKLQEELSRWQGAAGGVSSDLQQAHNGSSERP